MNIEELREFCLSLPGVTEDIKWENNLVFSVGGKMFCLADLEPPLRVSLKVEEDEFVRLTGTSDIIQAPYFARMMWVCVQNEERFSTEEWQHYLRNSYELVKVKLPKKVQEGLKNNQ
jgi:predicted DNA-binding protein (MmcQ/YjbR family)